MNILEDTLNEIYNNFQHLNKQINNKNVSLENLENVISSLDKYDNQLKNIYKMINSINNIKDHLKLLYSNKITNIKNLSIKNITDDQSKYDYTIDLINITNNDKFKNKKFCKCPVITISEDAISTMINSPIYLIKETNEYCIKINNKLIKGNIGNILNDKKIKKCNRMYCNQKFYSKKECKYYHEGKDVRNFPNYSWNTIIKNKIGKSRQHNNNLIPESYDLENTRFIGSLNTLLEDLALTNKYEKKLRNNQLMHDLLLYQILDQYLE